MQVFKFGGASVKDANEIKNLVEIIKNSEKELVVVVSAISKTTRSLEKIVDLYLTNSVETNTLIDVVFDSHKSICHNLFESVSDPVFLKIDSTKAELMMFVNHNKSPNRDFVYDQIIGFGELLSTIIISSYLNYVGVDNLFLDIRTAIKTDDNYRNANVDWRQTQAKVKELVKKNSLVITQGFIGSDDNNFTTSLGLEGSDYSAAILAYCLNAESVTVWKDVSGILNADPRFFKNTTLLNHISFKEAIELSYYGASVIHPKTIQPLQHKEIPLYVKGFKDENPVGTVINKGVAMDPLIPCFIIKNEQILLSISALDFSFIVEENISEIFGLISKFKLNVNLIQNSAISFTISLEDNYSNIDKLLNSLKSRYKLKYNTDVKLYTIRHYTDKNIIDFEQGKDVLLKQFSRGTAQFIVR